MSGALCPQHCLLPPARKAVLPFVLGWTYLLFPTISSRGFRAIAPCDCFRYVNGSQTCLLREDYAIECTGSLFGRPSAPPSVLAPACAAIVLWAVGVPLLYAWLLRRVSGLLGPRLIGTLAGAFL